MKRIESDCVWQTFTPQVKFICLALIFQLFHSESLFSQWKRLPLPTAASAYVFAQDSLSYYTGTSAGVYKSFDKGTTWQKTGLEEHSITELFVTEKGTLLAGTYRAGMFRSENGGQSWQTVGFKDNVYLYKILQTNKDTLLAIATFVRDGADTNKTLVGVVISTNDGKSWSQSGLKKNDIMSLSNPVKGLIFASGRNSLYVSKNQGLTWTITGGGLPDSIPISDIIKYKNSLIASVGNRQDASGQAGGGIFRSEDDGSNWRRSDSGLIAGSKVSCINVKGNVIFASAGYPVGNYSKGIYQSTDGGYRWKHVGLDEIVRFIKVTTDGQLICGTDGASVFISNNGIDWTQSGKEFDCWDVFNVFKNGKTIYASDQALRVWKKNAGNDWKNIGQGYVNVLPSGKLVTFSNNKIVVSRNEGRTWTKQGEFKSKFIRFITLNDTMVVGCSFNGLLLSKDDGNTWQKFDVPGFNDANFRTVLFTPDGAILAAYSSNDRGTGILCSKDGGSHWEKVADDLFVFSLFYHNGYVYVGSYSKGVLRSADNGTTWQTFNNGLRNEDEYISVTSFANFRNTLYCGTLGKGTFQFSISSGTWRAFNAGLTNMSVWDLFADRKGVLAATKTGIFQLNGD